MKNKRFRIEMKLSLTDIDDSKTTHVVLAPEPSHESSQVMEVNLNSSEERFDYGHGLESALSTFAEEVAALRAGIVRDLLGHRKR